MTRADAAAYVANTRRRQKRRREVNYDAAATALLARLSNPASAQRADLVDAAIKRLKVNTVAFTKLDYLHVYAAKDAQMASLNWLGTLFTASLATFVADRYVVGNGVNTYIGTGFNPGDGGVYKYLRNDAYFGAWSVSVPQTSGPDCGQIAASPSMTLGFRGGTNLMTGRINHSSAAVSAVASNDGSGMFGMARNGSATARFSRNGVLTDSPTNASTAVANGEFTLGRSNTTYTARRYVLSMAGGYLTAAEELAIYNAMLPYLQALGAVA